MIDRRVPFFVTAAIAAILLVSTPFRPLSASPGGMLSTSAASGEVQDALIAEPAPAARDEAAAPGQDGRLAPWKVSMITAVVPGFGQVYNKSAWKLPIYYGLMGYFASRVIDDSDKYQQYRDEYNETGSSEAADNRDKYREKRNTQLVWLILTHVAGIVDAYVDAQLYDFDNVMESGVGSASPLGNDVPALSVSMKF